MEQGREGQLGLRLDHLLFKQLSTLAPTLLLDESLGIALNREIHNKIIITTNQTVEYLIDVQNKNPDMLISLKNIPDIRVISDLLKVCSKPLYIGPPLISTLTSCERQVLQLMSYQYSDKRIASTLSRSPKTVSNQVSAVLDKLNLKNRHEASEYYWGRFVEGRYTYAL